MPTTSARSVSASPTLHLLISHEHFDHVGGIARLQQLTGATLVTSAPAEKVLNTGVASIDDPQAGMHKPFRAASVGRVIGDGGEVRLHDVSLIAMTTPGHTPGALSWRWESCDGGVCRTMVYADSLTPVSRDDYKFSDHPEYLAAYRASIAKIAASRCEILLTPAPVGQRDEGADDGEAGVVRSERVQGLCRRADQAAGRAAGEGGGGQIALSRLRERVG